MRSAAGCAMGLALSCLVLASGSAVAGAASSRGPVDVAQPPWRSLGRVQTELGARCTGFLVAPRLAMTAAHCLFIRRTGTYIQPSDVHFLWRYNRGSYAGAARVVRFIVPAGYDPKREHQTIGLDRAVLMLDADLGSPADFARIAARLPAMGTAAALGGYNRDRGELVDADMNCSVLDIRPDQSGLPIILHNCSGEPGTSGAPLFVRSGAGWVVAGMQVAIRTGSQPVGLAVALAGAQLRAPAHQP